MRSGRLGAARGDVLRLFDGGSVAGLGDGELLGRFADRRDEAAFEGLVARLGPMVLGVCRRMLADPHDVDDAFQATFLVLVRRAGSIRDRDLVGPWLHGVAARVARRARAESSRRKARDRIAVVPEAVEAVAEVEPGWPELRALIDEEIDRLPEHHRRAVVLCDVEGLSREEAAIRLGWTLNMVRGRLERARGRLRGQLARRGLAPPGTWAALVASPPIPPPALASSTIRAALASPGGQVGAGLATAPAVALSRGVLRMMMLAKLKLGLAALVSTGLAGLMAIALANPQAPPVVAQDGPPGVKKSGRRLPDVAGAPTGVMRFSNRRDPNAPKPNLDAAPEVVPVRISGVVHDLEDGPISGATVYAIGIQILDEPKLTIKTIVVATATTGKDGSYTFPGVKVPTSRNRHVPQALTTYVRFKVLVKAPGFGFGWHEDQEMYAIDPPDPADIQGSLPLGSPVEMSVYLRPEADLNGRVVNEDGKPVAGIKVGLHDVNLLDERGMETAVGINMRSEDWPGNLGRAATDADGRFRLPGLPAEGCCWLFFERPESKGNKALYASTSAESKTNHGQPEHRIGRGPHEVFPRDMTVSMPSTRKLEVRVVADDDGKPVPGVGVSSIGESMATGVSSWGTTDSEGRADLDLPPGRYRGLSARPDATSSRFVRASLGPFEVAADPKVQRIELRMKAGFELVLEAVDEATDKGIPGIHFQIKPDGLNSPPWEPVRSTSSMIIEPTSDADGKLRAMLVPVPGTAYRVRVLGAERGDPTVPAPPPLPGDGLPYDVVPMLSDPFERAAGKSATFRFTLKKR